MLNRRISVAKRQSVMGSTNQLTSPSHRPHHFRGRSSEISDDGMVSTTSKTRRISIITGNNGLEECSVTTNIVDRTHRVSIITNPHGLEECRMMPRRSKAPRHSVIEALRVIDDTVQILEVGCGSSQLAVELARAYGDRVHITAVDYAEPVIRDMRVLHCDVKNVTWETMDVRQLALPDDYFDVVIEKGCLDCVHCFSPLDEIIDKSSRTNIVQAVSEIERVLKPNGHLISVSHAQPEQRTQHFSLDNLFYERVGNQLAKKAKEQRRASIGPRGSITISALAQSPARMARGIPLVSTLAGKWVFDRPAIHPIDRGGRVLPESTHVTEADEMSRLASGNIGGWMDNQFFVYVVQKSKLLGDIAGRASPSHHNVGALSRRPSALPNNTINRNTLMSPSMKASSHQLLANHQRSNSQSNNQLSARKPNSFVSGQRSPRVPSRPNSQGR